MLRGLDGSDADRPQNALEQERVVVEGGDYAEEVSYQGFLRGGFEG